MRWLLLLIMKFCRWVAEGFGRVALWCESYYYRLTEAQRA